MWSMVSCHVNMIVYPISVTDNQKRGKFDFAHLADAIIREQEDKREPPSIAENRANYHEDDVTPARKHALPLHARMGMSAFR